MGAILALLTSCAAPRDLGGPDPTLRGQWELQTATDAAGPIPLANQLVTLTIDGDTTTTGRSTCGDYRARVYGDVEALSITATLPRIAHCGIQAQEDIERRYLADLNQVHTGSLSGAVLDLLADGIDLHYQRALAVPLNLVVNRSWRLTAAHTDSYYGSANATVVDLGGATLRFAGNGILTGTTGCHRFTAKYIENAGEIVAQHLVEHPFGRCTGEGRTADDDILTVVDDGFTFFSESGALNISSPRAELTLSFVD
jgi:heat shock protein HslJ